MSAARPIRSWQSSKSLGFHPRRYRGRAINGRWFPSRCNARRFSSPAPPTPTSAPIAVRPAASRRQWTMPPRASSRASFWGSYKVGFVGPGGTRISSESLCLSVYGHGMELRLEPLIRRPCWHFRICREAGAGIGDVTSTSPGTFCNGPDSGGRRGFTQVRQKFEKNCETTDRAAAYLPAQPTSPRLAFRGVTDVGNRLGCTTEEGLRLPAHGAGAHHPLGQRRLHHLPDPQRAADLQRPPGALLGREVGFRRSAAQHERAQRRGRRAGRRDKIFGKTFDTTGVPRLVLHGRPTAGARLPVVDDGADLPRPRHRPALALLLRLAVRHQWRWST